MIWRLVVVDGADQGRSFPLSEGIMTIGKSHRNSEICLNDLYVARVHCEVEVNEGRVVVTDVDEVKGIYVNGQKVKQQELKLGDVLRVGNSHLRLEPHDGSAPAEPVEELEVLEEPARLPQFSIEQLAKLSGATLGHYAVGPVLGRGRRGMVFLSRDMKTNQIVALKVLAAGFPKNDGEMQRFVGAIKTALPLRHPNLVGVLGAGKTGPYCWIATEYVEGDNLGQVIEQKANRGWKKALRVTIHVARALAFAARHNLLHGNVTPQNILSRKNDKVVKLADLVLARALEGSDLERDTRDDKFQAELPYLSPEHLPGGGKLACWSDIHSLGAVVYHLLAGQRPFGGPSPEDTMAEIREAVPVTPKDYLETLPDDFEALVLKMLAKQPDERYHKPGELLADAEAVAKKQGLWF
jgi:serine/threonine protein kinase